MNEKEQIEQLKKDLKVAKMKWLALGFMLGLTLMFIASGVVIQKG